MGFKVYLDGELVKEYEGMHETVNRVAISSSQGEDGSVNVPNTMDSVYITVEKRNNLESTYQDLTEQERVYARQREVEEASKDAVTAGRKLQREMDAKAAQEQEEARAAAMGIAPNEEEDARVTEPAAASDTTGGETPVPGGTGGDTTASEPVSL